MVADPKVTSVIMTRTFHPVGQGAFYSEEFKGKGGNALFRVLYDCGCIWGDENQKHGMRVLRGQIKRWKESGHTGVDYLFVSHFDFDHVSLLRTLRNEDVEVGRVISPLLEDDEKTSLENFYKGVLAGKDSKFVRELIEDPGIALGSANTRIRAMQDGEPLANVDCDENDARRGQVRSGTRFPVCVSGVDIGWRYIPCNVNLKCRGEAFRAALVKKFGKRFDPKTLDDFPKLMKLRGCGKRRAFQKLKEVYESIEGNVNENSMTVYSGPVNAEVDAKMDRSRLMWDCGRGKCPPPRELRCQIHADGGFEEHLEIGPACVYTGDVDLKQAKVREWYGGYWNRVGTIQVPHHGSRLSFAPSAFSDSRYCCPVSCSDRCYYGHPHACVTNRLTAVGSTPVRVTESMWLEQDVKVVQRTSGF